MCCTPELLTAPDHEIATDVTATLSVAVTVIVSVCGGSLLYVQTIGVPAVGVPIFGAVLSGGVGFVGLVGLVGVVGFVGVTM